MANRYGLKERPPAHGESRPGDCCRCSVPCARLQTPCRLCKRRRHLGSLFTHSSLHSFGYNHLHSPRHRHHRPLPTRGVARANVPLLSTLSRTTSASPPNRLRLGGGGGVCVCIFRNEMKRASRNGDEGGGGSSQTAVKGKPLNKPLNASLSIILKMKPLQRKQILERLTDFYRCADRLTR